MTTRFADNETIKELESLQKQNLEQAAVIEMMRNELLLMTRDKWHWQEARDRALSITPSQALEAFAAKVREQCVEKIAIQKYSAPRYAEEHTWNAGIGAAIATIKGIKELP